MTPPTGSVVADGAASAQAGAPFTAPTSADEVREYVRANGIQFVFAQFVDMHGKPNAKLVPVAHLDDLFTEGAGFAGFAAGEIGQAPNDPDLIAIPDVRSFTPLPWRPEVARFACDVTVEGQEWPYCPRTILRRQLERAAALGFEFRLGAELEYFLVRLRDDGSIELADKLDTLSQPCYDMRALTRNLDFVGAVATNVSALGWDNYATDHEDANGQFEQNFAFSDALTTCDRAIFFRYMVEAMAQERGLIATFMPKPFAHLTGNGCHMHMSLWRDGESAFEIDPADDPAGSRRTPRPTSP
jgi:glutamine synthetase